MWGIITVLKEQLIKTWTFCHYLLTHYSSCSRFDLCYDEQRKMFGRMLIVLDHHWHPQSKCLNAVFLFCWTQKIIFWRMYESKQTLFTTIVIFSTSYYLMVTLKFTLEVKTLEHALLIYILCHQKSICMMIKLSVSIISSL